MLNALDIIAQLLINYYPPIGNIEHKYRTKVTAIGLLKQVKMDHPKYITPYFERLKGYKLLIVDLLDNFKLSENEAVNIFSEIIYMIIQDGIRAFEDKKEPAYILPLMYMISPKLKEEEKDKVKPLMKKFLSNAVKTKAYNKMAEYILDNFIDTEDAYEDIARMIVEKCLTGVKQEDVIKRLSHSMYNFFVYGLYDKGKMQLLYDIVLKKEKVLEQFEPFFNLKILSRFIISTVSNYKTTVNIFGTRIDNFDEIKSFFKRHSNITVMFF